MIIGRQRARCIVQVLTETGNASGAVDEEWADVFSRRCSIEFKSGTDTYSSDSEKPLSGYTVVMRYDSSVKLITPSHRLKIDGELYRITSRHNIDRKNQSLSLECEAWN